MNPITPAELAAYFDHTQLRAYAPVSYTHLLDIRRYYRKESY